MKVLIVGSSGYKDLLTVRHWVRVNLRRTDTVLVTSSNRVEVTALNEAAAMGLRGRVVRPKIDRYRPSYTDPKTKEQVLRDADKVVVFYDGKSLGTKSTIAIARGMGKPIDIIGG